MFYRLAALVACCALPILSHGENGNHIYRWVDEAGIVHYGDTVPDKYKDSATHKPQLKTEHPVIDVEGTAREQQARQRAREVLQPENPAAPAAAPANANTPEPTVSENTGDMTCEEQWQRYNASQACFAQFRLANGAIRPEAYEKCVAVPQPPRCE